MIAGLIQCNPEPAVIDFLVQVVEGIDAVTLAPEPVEEHSTVVIEEVEEPKLRKGPTSPAVEEAGPSPLRRSYASKEHRGSREARAQQLTWEANAGATRATPEKEEDKPTQAPQGAPADEVGAAWVPVEEALEEACRLSKCSRAAENAALAALEGFLQCHGEVGEQQASKWVSLAQVAAAAQARAARGRRLALQKQEEARLAGARERIEEARRAREAVEEEARRAREDAQRRVQQEVQRGPERKSAWPTRSSTPTCFPGASCVASLR